MDKQDLESLLTYIASGQPLVAGTKMYEIMHFYSDEALRIVAQLNTGFHDPAERRALMSELTGRPVPDSFSLFPPFYSDFGKNIHLGENIFINSCACFQDQGGIFIASGCFIGHRVTIATINHGLPVQERHIHHLKPVRLEENVWLGSDVTILPGVSIGKGAVVGAGSVVIRDVPAMTVYAGNPARKIRDIPAEGKN